MGRHDEDWAVFWCSLLSPLRTGEIPVGERRRYFQQLSQQERQLPSGRRGTISARTLRRQWKKLCAQGVKGLFRQPRSDRGQSRQKREEIVAEAVRLKKEQPRRSVKVINHILQAKFGQPVPRATLYRHLRQAGATRRRLGVSVEKVRCRWSRDQPDAMWVGDFEHGPIVMHQGQAIKTHLSAWIDCHSRYIVEARYYIRENLDILVDSLLRAWGHHGASRELYVDNAKIYHAKKLKLACGELNIHLGHRPPGDPPAGGVIERFFQTAQGQLEAEVRATPLLSLEQLNLVLAAWLQTHYHQDVHSETGQSPQQRYASEQRVMRQVDLGEVLQFFHNRVKRTVDRTFSDVQVDNLLYRVHPDYRGEKVLVEYDPFSDRQEVQIYSLSGTFLAVGNRYQRERGSHPPPSPAAAVGPVAPEYLDVLRANYQEQQRQQRDSGIDYQAAQQGTRALTTFAGKLARLLGRKGGVSALSAEELEVLSAFHTRHPRIHEDLLRQAVQQAETKSIPQVLFQLQFLLQERKC